MNYRCAFAKDTVYQIVAFTSVLRFSIIDVAH